MVKLSIVYVARDDRYGDDYNVVEFAKNDIRNNPFFSKTFTIKYNNIQRIKTALELNIKMLDKYFTNNFDNIVIPLYTGTAVYSVFGSLLAYWAVNHFSSI